MSEKKTKKIERIIKAKRDLKKFAKKKRKLIDVSDLIKAINNNPEEFKEKLGDEAKNNPGCYKWWAEKDDVEKLLSKILYGDEKHKNIFSETDFNEILEKEENFYCIYVGKANNLYDRLRNHAKNTETSTLRRTICSLTCNQDDSLKEINSTVDEWLGKFRLQYFPLFKSERTAIEESGKQTIYKLKDTEKELSLLDLEYFFINENFHILNVDVNHYVEYTKKKGNYLNNETEVLIKKILTELSDKKKEWSKETIAEKKKK